MNKHTTGPWVARELGGSFDEPRWVILWPDKSKGGVHMRRLDDHGELDKEDAQVMAAAPELLKSAESVVAAWDKFLGSFDYVPGIGDTAEDLEFREMLALRAAIAKARSNTDAPT